jgi:DNA invertase Pin-like site-specific DNA recombinase
MSRIAPRRRSPPTAFQTHALAYARVSTEEQVLEGVSLEAQVASLHAYLALRGLVLHPLGILLERGVSGGIPLEKRPEGQRLVEAVRRGEVAHVVTVKLDRLFRSAENCLAQLGQWEASGVALHLVDMGGQSIDTRSTL